VDVKDLRGRIAKAVGTYERYPFLRDLTHMDDERIQNAAQAANEALDREGYEVHHYVEDAKPRWPQLHLKAQFYASSEAWDTFFSLAAALDTGGAFVTAWARQLSNETAEPTEFQEAMAPYVEKVRESITGQMPEEELEKAIVYLGVGSQNMDYRGMYLDGEVTYISTHGGVLTGVLDLLHVIEVSDWVDDVDTLDEYMGSYGWITRHIARWATPLM